MQILLDFSKGAMIKDADPTSTLELHSGRFQTLIVLQLTVID